MVLLEVIINPDTVGSKFVAGCLLGKLEPAGNDTRVVYCSSSVRRKFATGNREVLGDFGTKRLHL